MIKNKRLFTALLSTLLPFAGAESNANTPQENTPMQATSLKAQLDERKQSFSAKAPDDIKKIYAEGIESVEKDGVVKAAKQVGEPAPDFTLKNAMGEDIRLEEVLKDGPVILTWYRGGWCPYCNLTLNALQKELPAFQAEGATLLALTPELPDNSISTAEKAELEFVVLSDLNNQVARKYGIVFELTPEVASIYENKFSLSTTNGNNSNELPLAATYVIQPDGKIVYAFLDSDYRNRAEPKEILKALKSITP
ncbi:peroxiredoxin-like family protein [Kiritimatiellaeota bacterium B1221]|nr:peroxiredoxin-like family protein [Kiritimatiellaeota bacterium B1221]